MKTLKQLMSENTLYSNDQEKGVFLSDESNIIDAFVFNFLGILGTYNAAILSDDTTTKKMINGYFRTDKKLRIDSIGDDNLNISLVIKLMNDANMFNSTRVIQEMTKFLVIARKGNLGLVDDSIIQGWVKKIKTSAVNKASPRIKLLLGMFVDGEIDMKNLAYALKAVRVTHKEVSQDYWQYAKKVDFGSALEVNIVNSPDDTPDDDEPEVVQEPAWKTYNYEKGMIDFFKGYVERNGITKLRQNILGASKLANGYFDLAYRDSKNETIRDIASQTFIDGVLVNDISGFPLDLTENDQVDQFIKNLAKLAVISEFIKDLIEKKADIQRTLSKEVILDTVKSNNFLTQESTQYLIDTVRQWVINDLPELLKSAGHEENVLHLVVKNFNETFELLGITGKDIYNFLKENDRNIYDKINFIFTNRTYTVKDLSDYKQNVIEFLQEMGVDEVKLNTRFKRNFTSTTDSTIFSLEIQEDYEKTLEMAFQFLRLIASKDSVNGAYDYDIRQTVSDFKTTIGELNTYGAYAAKSNAFYQIEVNDLVRSEFETIKNIFENKTDFSGHKDFLQNNVLYFGKVLSDPKNKIDPEANNMIKQLISLMGQNSPKDVIRMFASNNDKTDENAKDALKLMIDDGTITIDQIKDTIMNNERGADGWITPVGVKNLFKYVVDYHTDNGGDVQAKMDEFVDKEMIEQTQMFAYGSQYMFGYHSTDKATNEVIFLAGYKNTDKETLERFGANGLYHRFTSQFDLSGEFGSKVAKLEVENGFPLFNVDNIKSISSRKQQKEAESSIFDIMYDTIHTDPDIGDKFYENMTAHYQRKIKNRITGIGAIVRDIKSGDIQSFDNIDGERVKQILEFNELDADEIAKQTKLRTKRNEKFSQYVKRVEEETGNNALEPLKVADDELSTQERAEINKQMVDSHHAGYHGNVYPIITKSFNVSFDNTLYEAFMAEVKERDGQVDQVIPSYHGTGGVAATMILRYGFTVVPSTDSSVVGRMLGDGIYFTNKIDKSLQYVGNSGFTRRHGTKGYVFDMESILGKKSLNEYGVAGNGDGIKSPEWAVRDPTKQLKMIRVYEVELGTHSSYTKHLKKNNVVNEKKFSTFINEASKEKTNMIIYRFYDGRVPVQTDQGITYKDLKDHSFPYGINAFMVGDVANVEIQSDGFEGYDIAACQKMERDELEQFLKLTS